MFGFIPEIYGGALAFAAVVALMPPAIRLAAAKGFVDAPGGRKRHAAPVPPIGGLVIFTVMVLTNMLIGIDFKAYWPLYAGLGVIVLTGAFDDYRHINPWIKFTAQFAAAAIIVIAGQARLYHLGGLFGPEAFDLGFMSLPFSIVAIVLFINALNLMDGLDGLAGGVSFAALLWLMIACATGGAGAYLYVLAPLAGALLGFLHYNLRRPGRARAVVFLGDAGSMGLALVLAWFCIDLAQDPAPLVIKPIAIAWIIGLPIIDVCAQFYRRARAGKHPFSPDRGHFHHHFIEAGFSVAQASFLIILVSFVLGGIGVGGLMLGVPEWALCGLWIVMILTHIAVSARPARYIGALKRLGGL